MNFYDEARRLGLNFSADGARVTLYPACLPALFDHPANCQFEITLSTTDLWQIRGLLVSRVGELHVPAQARFETSGEVEQRGTRLIVESSPWLPLKVLATYWWTDEDGSESQLRVHALLNLHPANVLYFWHMDSMWSAGVRPLHRLPLHVAAGLNAREAIELESSGRTAEDIEGALMTLAALRSNAA
ncbi:hypothetical protein [Geodermatophilus sp. SYSU D01176]